MAGTVFVADGVSWPVSTSVLEAVAELTRRKWPQESLHLCEPVFREVEIFAFIDLIGADERVFRSFTRATCDAFADCRDHGTPPEWPPDAFDLLETPWAELIHLLKRDPRWNDEIRHTYTS